MKSILLSIKPKWVAKILNGEKTIEVRKRFPKEYKGWVYIYCTKPTKHIQLLERDRLSGKWKLWYGTFTPKNGKVVARFYCDKVEEITPNISLCDNEINTFLIDSKIDVLKASCLTEYEMEKYLCPNYDGDKPLEYLDKVVGYAIHISQLEIFDKPKELSEFYRASCKGCFAKNTNYCDEKYCRITKAPQNLCYVEVEE